MRASSSLLSQPLRNLNRTVRALSELDILGIWEIAKNQHPIDRALTILAVANSDAQKNELAILSKGQRDKQLLAIREATFGSKINGLAQCEACQEKLEIILNLSDIAVEYSPNDLADEHTISCNDYEIRFRLPNSYDLAATVNCGNVKSARRIFIQRCISAANRKGRKISKMKLPKSVIKVLEDRIAEIDPQAEIRLDLRCDMCEHRWQIDFDIASFLWTEIAARAKRLLYDVYALARFYGWSEQDILSINPLRRKFYLEMIH